ncbi:MAG: type I-E CRISPR-associated protein Cas5/CasD [Phycisphaeraceae bacterium]|nr:type I-E CRISPR-associated protein Cas5/CasD [Phycisphaeraceae bacterium]
MSEVHTLLLRLEGTMQSWGYRSRFDYRDTALEPTRSGVIGLLCAAMGIARDEYKDHAARFDTVRMGVRVDKEGRPERDYHTALDVIKADGSGTDKVVSRRDYLADAAFTVGLESADTEFLNAIADALRHPRFFLYLGRKAFPLTVPPLGPDDRPGPGTLEEHLLTGDGEGRVMLEAPDGERTQHDWPLCFGQRRFKPRRIKTAFSGQGASA